MSRTQGQGLHSGVFKGQLLAQWEQDMGCLGQLFHLCNRDAWHENSQVSLPVSSNTAREREGRKARLDRAWNKLVQWKVSLQVAGDGMGWALKSLLSQTLLGFHGCEVPAAPCHSLQSQHRAALPAGGSCSAAS